MINSALTSKNLVAALELLVTQRLDATRVATFALVTAVNDNTTVDAQPIVEEAISSQQGKKIYKQLPVIKNIPYLLLGTPKVGQYCVLLHLDRGIASTRFDTKTSTEDIKYIKHSGATHKISDCVAIIGFKNISKDLDSSEEFSEVASANTANIANSAIHYLTENNEKINIDETFENLLDRISDIERNYVLKLAFPVGSIFLTTNPNYEPAEHFGLTWQLLPEGYALWTASTIDPDHPTIDAGLPNITGTVTAVGLWKDSVASGAFSYVKTSGANVDGAGDQFATVNFDANNGATTKGIYGNSTTVQPPAYKVYAWIRVRDDEVI